MANLVDERGKRRLNAVVSADASALCLERGEGPGRRLVEVSSAPSQLAERKEGARLSGAARSQEPSDRQGFVVLSSGAIQIARGGNWGLESGDSDDFLALDSEPVGFTEMVCSVTRGSVATR